MIFHAIIYLYFPCCIDGLLAYASQRSHKTDESPKFVSHKSILQYLTAKLAYKLYCLSSDSQASMLASCAFACDKRSHLRRCALAKRDRVTQFHFYYMEHAYSRVTAEKPMAKFNRLSNPHLFVAFELNFLRKWIAQRIEATDISEMAMKYSVWVFDFCRRISLSTFTAFVADLWTHYGFKYAVVAMTRNNVDVNRYHL